MGEAFGSTKKPYEISLAVQSKLATRSFSFPVSQAKRNGSNMSLGLSAAFPLLTSSKAIVVAVMSGWERFASLELRIVLRAVVMRMGDNVEWPEEIEGAVDMLVNVVVDGLAYECPLAGLPTAG